MFDVFDDIGDAFDAVSNFFSLMLDPNTYTRIFFVVFGAVLIFGAVSYGR
jgi:ABC-type enterochelin transport system permease subunit